MRINNLVAVAVTSLIMTAPAVLAQFSKSTVSSQINTQFPDQNTGQITPATTRAFLNNMLNSYQQYAGTNVQAGITYTVQPSDYGQLIQFNGGNVAVTISPANSSGYTTYNFYAQNITSGNVVITPTGGSTICGASALTLANAQNVWVVSDGTNYQCVTSPAYSFGSWTPTLVGSSSGSFTMSTQVGSYEKIGRQIIARASIATSAKLTPLGNLQINGLPFLSGATTNDNGICAIAAISGWTAQSGYDLPGAFISPSTQVIAFIESASTKTAVSITPGEMAASSAVNLMCSYHTD